MKKGYLLRVCYSDKYINGGRYTDITSAYVEFSFYLNYAIETPHIIRQIYLYDFSRDDIILARIDFD